MKKFNLLVLVILIAIIFNSCGDIIDSDNNIKKTSKDYNNVIENQETGVIMPLKVGNKWIYEAKQFDSTGATVKEYLDTIEVLTKIVFKGEIWFRVKMINYGYNWISILTNTDKGLYTSEECPNLNCTYIVAQYPSVDSPLISIQEDNVVILRSEGGREVIDTVTSQYLIELNTNYTTNYKSTNYSARKFSTYNTILEMVGSKKLVKEEIFVPNVGLFDHKIYRFDKSGKQFVLIHYKLIETNLID